MDTLVWYLLIVKMGEHLPQVWVMLLNKSFWEPPPSSCLFYIKGILSKVWNLMFAVSWCWNMNQLLPSDLLIAQIKVTFSPLKRSRIKQTSTKVTNGRTWKIVQHAVTWTPKKWRIRTIPIAPMYDIFIYIWLILMVNRVVNIPFVPWIRHGIGNGSGGVRWIYGFFSRIPTDGAAGSWYRVFPTQIHGTGSVNIPIPWIPSWAI